MEVRVRDSVGTVPRNLHMKQCFFSLGVISKWTWLAARSKSVSTQIVAFDYARVGVYEGCTGILRNSHA